MSMEYISRKTIVVGAGPAGMMAAIRASGAGAGVAIFDLNTSPGKKLLLTGAGRCNLTNAGSLDEFLRHFSPTGKFLRDAFKAFDNRDLMEFFEKRGLDLKVEEKGRVFPGDDKSSSVLDILEREMAALGVKKRMGKPVKDIVLKEGCVVGVELEGGTSVGSDSVILATGGLSYGMTGSRGQGIEIARKHGHEIVPPRPGLVPVQLRGTVPKDLEGISIKKAEVSFICGNKRIKTPIDGLMFTAKGISGPSVIPVSGKIYDLAGEGRSVQAVIDLYPGIDAETLEKRLLSEFSGHPGKQVKSTVEDLFPKRLVLSIMDMAGIAGNRTANQLTRKERKAIVSVIKGMRFDVAGTASFDRAMITRGGVSVKDIDPRTMASRRVKGLYFAGEMIDVDADTGGYNLQACFSTGYLAGQSAASV